MLYTPHFLVGAAIVKLVPNPAVGVPLALLSHFVLDLTPHNDFDLHPGITLKEFFAFPKKRLYFILGVMGVDYLFTIFSFLWIWFHFQNHWLLLGGLAGVIPDMVEQFLMLFGIALPGWQDKLQWRVSARYGFIGYPIVSFLALCIIYR